MKDLIKLEEEGWQALSDTSETGKTFYDSILHDDAIMLFPGGLRLTGKETILESLAAQPWQSFQIKDAQIISFSEGTAVVVYEVKAQREGDDPYVALISSTYILSEDGWKLILHQQTPEG